MNEDEGLSDDLEQYYTEYFILQRALTGILRSMGIHYQVNDRLDLFWLRVKLIKLARPEEMNKLESAIGLIDSMVEFRRNGLEPPHKYGKYH